MKTRKNQSFATCTSPNSQNSAKAFADRNRIRMKMRASIAVCLAAVLTMAILAMPSITSAATQVTCQGIITIIPILSSFEITEDGTQKIIEFDFTGTHPLCMPDGSEVTANIAGHMVQHLSDNGLTLQFDETLSFGGDSLDFRGEASLAGSNWQSHVQTTGQGSGALAGVSAQGSFFPTADPTVLTDVLFYVFH
jgi:hypothetical protein